jgi:hypothetical protein
MATENINVENDSKRNFKKEIFDLVKDIIII